MSLKEEKTFDMLRRISIDSTIDDDDDDEDGDDEDDNYVNLGRGGWLSR